MANAARSDIGRQEVLAKSQVVLGKEWQAKTLAENYLIEICRLLGNLCYDCPEGRSQVDLLCSDICQMDQQETPVFTNF